MIIPPSRILIPEHQGRAYAWEVRPWEEAIAEAPAWTLNADASMNAASPRSLAQALDPWIVQEASEDLLTHPGSPEGSRHHTYIKLAGVHIARGDSEASIRAMSEAWASRCSPPYDEWEKQLRGLLAKEEAKAVRMTTPTLLICNSAEADSQADILTSLPADGKQSDGELSVSWPTLPPEAYHGLFGEMLKAVSPQTEADPAGVLLGWLACFGNVVGRGAWVQVGPRKHLVALYVGVVGRTSDAKGDSWAASLWPFREVESAWASACITHGVSSGEGLVERIADAEMTLDSEGKAQVIQAGALDKRCLLRLSELSRCFKVGRRENNPLSEHLREAWDGEPIHVPNRKRNGNALSASEYAVSLFGDITPEVLRKLLASGTEAFDGSANRYLWCAVRSSGDLPDGGNIGVLTPFLERLAQALAFAKSAGELTRDAEAKALWDSVYPQLKRSGDSVPHTDRARPYAVRLSMLYALADHSTTIKVEHLKAALAVWNYCRESARLIFGGQQQPKPEADQLWLQVLSVIQHKPGIKKEALTIAFKNHMKAPELDENLRYLETQGLAYRMELSANGKGRPAECWFPGKPEGDGLGDENDNPTPSLSPEAASKEVSNSDRKSAKSELLTSLLPSAEASSPWVVQADNGKDEVGCHSKSRDEADKALEPEAFLSAISQEKRGFDAKPDFDAMAWVGVPKEEQRRIAEAWRKQERQRREREGHERFLKGYAEAQARREAEEYRRQGEDDAFDGEDFLSHPSCPND